MPTFGDIVVPVEVFREILTHVPRNHLPSCALVSSTWNANVTPFLYQSIELHWSRTRYLCYRSHVDGHPNPCTCEGNGRCNPEDHQEERPINLGSIPCLRKVPSPSESYGQLYPLARTVISSPNLARYVQRLCLIGAVPRSIWTDPEQTELSHDDRDRVWKVLCSGPHTACSNDSWVEMLEMGSPTAFAALLLMCLDNLRALEIGAEFGQPLSFLGNLPAILERLPHLTTTSLGTFRQEVYMAPGRLPSVRACEHYPLLLFYLSNIRSLSLNLPNGSCFSSLDPLVSSCLPLSANLELLELTYTFMNEHDLGRLLVACQNLRTLKYDLWTTCRDPARRPNESFVELSVLQKSLLLVKATLEAFHLHVGKYNWASGSWSDDFNHIHGYMSFIDFPNLTTLHVPLQVLIGDDSAMLLKNALPRTLVDLWINDDGFDFPHCDDPGTSNVCDESSLIEIISGFLIHWKDFTPSLKTIRILAYQVPYLCWEQWDPELLADSLVPLGKVMGLEVDVVMLPWRQCVSEASCRILTQGAPYFDFECIERMRLFEKGPKT